MEPFSIFILAIFALGGIALIVLLIKYSGQIFDGIFIQLPKNLATGLFIRLFGIFLLPLYLLFLFIDTSLDLGLSERIDAFRNRKRKQERIGFKSYRKFILITESNSELLSSSIREAADTIKELDISNFKMKLVNDYQILEIPETNLYGYTFLISWLHNEFKKMLLALPLIRVKISFSILTLKIPIN